MAVEKSELPLEGFATRFEYVIVSERSDGVTVTSHDPPFSSLDEAVRRMVWNYRWQENNMRVESRLVAVSPLAVIDGLEDVVAAAVAHRKEVFARSDEGP